MNITSLIEEARSGNLIAQEKLAWHYYKGIKVKKSFRKAFFWYKESAKNGNPIVFYNLGLCYLDGEGTKVDYEQAFYWTKKSAIAGYADGMLALGWHYYNGCGVKQNLDKATKWYKRALEQEENGAAYFSLGEIAYDTKAFSDAASYFKVAYEKFNHANASYFLGRMYFEGKGVNKDYEQSLKLLKFASKRGVYNARRLLKSKKFKSCFP